MRRYLLASLPMAHRPRYPSHTGLVISMSHVSFEPKQQSKLQVLTAYSVARDSSPQFGRSSPFNHLRQLVTAFGTSMAVKQLSRGKILSAKPSDGGNNTAGEQNGRDKKEEESPIFPNSSSEDDNTEELIVARSVLFVLVMLGTSYVLYKLSQPLGKQTGWASLLKNAEIVKSIKLYHNYAQVYLSEGKVYLGLVDDQHTQEKLEKLNKAYNDAVTTRIKEPRPQGNGETVTTKSEGIEVSLQGTPLGEQALVVLGVFAWVVPFVFFPVFVMVLSNSIGKSLALTLEAGKKTHKSKEMVFRVELSSSTRFKHIAGLKEAKKEVTEVVDFLRHPERYTSLGAKVPTGALLLGPPGTGKTLLAKAVAGESGVGFIPVCGSDFVELYVGMGALRVRQLFEVAKKQRCIVYIDEIDAIGLKRTGAGIGEKQEQEHTLNELLTQLDGFSSSRRGDVMILASSNVSQEQLDPALVRPGRFDRIIHVDMPVISERIDIFKVHLSALTLVKESNKGAKGAEVEQQTEEASTESSESKKSDAKANAKSDYEGKMESGTVPSSENKSPTADEAKGFNSCEVSTANATTSSLVVSKLQEEMEAEQELLEQEKLTGDPSYDFRTLLANKSERERALINSYAERMSSLCPGFTGADIANVCNEAAILAARENNSNVDITHLERSIDRVLAGIEHRSRVLSPFERQVVAHHEAGHAVAGWFLNRADPLMKVSIVPRGGSALGYAQYLPNENNVRTAAEIRDSISVTLGGRVAEKIFFNHLSTGASDDLNKVARMAYMFVSSFAPRPVYPAPGTAGTRIVKPFGPKVSNHIDVEAKKLVDEIYEQTYSLLLSKKEEMETLAKHLLENEVLTFDDVVRYLGTRKARETDRKKGV
ncbi:ATP-dependent zinc metallopeptidase, putative [Trypanosoma brucei gambiense DAL972]|uniref:ATP-dependent zinc metallopeptidase, putative n=1 Tax=Trypanosoma brucei gambiense (strain MHOM/CI/86/DAL972) TaxID=679716 RepID=C9ZN81_TRYB9|nr:ATP-dependent zinc metallopeptidase, putative [Trypanosoma brucei gambiense DAL972]CBH10735.1 ATP-dependent zinc metallopeptidase, putative [Trypanosoma brucei gambiense DAL972]|eukprot:XP_011773023.1 ATP-dependent zinc metallopeptidase, putative [Trypanosoma brucei gambiense DAL972]